MQQNLDDYNIIKREKDLTNELTRFLDLLIRYESPEHIIVFGSLATGNISQWSDIDLLIIEETGLSFWPRLKRIRKLLKPKFGTDIFAYTPDEFDRLAKERLFFKEEILEKGIVLYEK